MTLSYDSAYPENNQGNITATLSVQSLFNSAFVLWRPIGAGLMLMNPGDAINLAQSIATTINAGASPTGMCRME